MSIYDDILNEEKENHYTPEQYQKDLEFARQYTASNITKTRKGEQEIETEYEFEQAYGVPYGKYITRLDTKFFDSKEYHQTFNKLTPNNDINESIYNYSKQAILDNWGTNKESMFLIDMSSNKLIASIENDKDKHDFEIKYTEEFTQALQEAIQKGTKIIAIHNHPHGYPPSLDDISKIAENHYALAIVAGANGLVYRYYNPNMTTYSEEERKDYHDIISFNIKSGYDIDRAHKEVYNTLGVSYDIIEGGSNNE